MVRLTRITTKTGDDGTTALGDGSRVAKHCPRIHALGEVDEANAAIGMIRCDVTGSVDDYLAAIQNDLFDVGADLCLPGARGLRVTPTHVTRLEQQQEQLNTTLKPLDSFILPAGSRAAAHLHLARTIVRRAERAVTALAAIESINPAVLHYINRLSDFLFVLARHENAKTGGDVLWVPGRNS